MSNTDPILKATESAIEALVEHTSTLDDDEHLARIAVAGRRNGSFQYDFEQIDTEDIQSEDQLVQLDFVHVEMNLLGAAVKHTGDLALGAQTGCILLPYALSRRAAQ